jgi:heme O synthase-like polyprenyltransferase
VLPLVQGEAGWLYLGTVLLLNGVLMVRCAALYRQIDRPRAASLYKFSLTYLFILFLVVAVDRAFLTHPVNKARALVVSPLVWGDNPHEMALDRKERWC